jgi:phosphate starvation-inducible PhoH-like protein
MGRTTGRATGKRANRFENRNQMIIDPSLDMPKLERGSFDPIKPKTDAQKAYLNAIRTHSVVFGTGPAGTGKTFIAVAEAADMLRRKEIETLIITRPAVEAGESMGFLPGEIAEKFDPYFAPVRDILNRRLGKGHVDGLIAAERIKCAPLAYMRGTTFENAFVIFDEAQNATPKQMEMFLGRIGNNTKVVVDGDLHQQDIPGPSGLKDAMGRFGQYKWFEHVQFTVEDVVRSGIARDIVMAYNKGYVTAAVPMVGYNMPVVDSPWGEAGAPEFLKTIKLSPAA